MIPISFKEQNFIYAKDQPEYLPLPAYRTKDGHVGAYHEKNVLKCYLLVTFEKPLQPQKVDADSPFKLR